MKILWIVNTILPQIAVKEKLEYGVNEGWLSGLSKSIQSYDAEIELHVCFPFGKQIYGCTGRMFYRSFSIEKKIEEYSLKQEQEFAAIYKEIKPEVVHIMGSEYPHSLAAVNAGIKTNYLDKIVLSLQGLVSVYANYFEFLLPPKTIKICTIRDIIKGDSLKIQKRKYEKRGKYEIEAIKKLKHIIGRTDWDYACSKQINPDINYYFNNETLRKGFYNDVWEYDKCEKNSIFVSQATLPYKGFHNLLLAVSIIKKSYPDMKLYVASNVNYVKRMNSYSQTRSAYTNYVVHLIKKYNLKSNIVFCGALTEKKMIQRYKQSNVFVLPSAIENSPNSLGEAMILGMPIVTNDVGGVKNMIIHKKEGYICQSDAPYMMAHYIEKIFMNGKKESKIGENARKHALITHDEEKNYFELIKIYKLISPILNKEICTRQSTQN